MITIIFGKPGAGKTAYLVSQMLRFLGNSREAYELLWSCRDRVLALDRRGLEYSLPTIPPVYTNFPVSAHVGYNKWRSSYYVDGFHLGLDNDYVPITNVFPGAVIGLTEVQRYYNSRYSNKQGKGLPDWVSRFYEEHRHFGLNIYLDLQRVGLCDLNIRELAGRFVEVCGLDHQFDHLGNILSSRFSLRCWDNLSAVERYVDNDSLTNYSQEEYIHEGNVFEAYTSTCYFDAFLPGTDKDFSAQTHDQALRTDAELQLAFSKEIYRQSAPRGFYPGDAEDLRKEWLKSRADKKSKYSNETLRNYIWRTVYGST